MTRLATALLGFGIFALLPAPAWGQGTYQDCVEKYGIYSCHTGDGIGVPTIDVTPGEAAILLQQQELLDAREKKEPPAYYPDVLGPNGLRKSEVERQRRQNR